MPFEDIDLRDHARTTGRALKNWLIAQTQDAAGVGVLWLAGLWIIGVPWAPLWAVLGGAFQFVPHIGLVLGLIGPVLAVALTAGGWMMLLEVLILYAIIAVVDGFFLQPYFMRHTARVPIWASILVPLLCAIFLPLWGVLLAPPLLAVIFAYRERFRKAAEQERQLATGGGPPATI